MFGKEIETQFKRAAILNYPNETVGVVLPDKTLEIITNTSNDPVNMFSADLNDFYISGRSPIGLIHSHTVHPEAPSALDMQQQIAAADTEKASCGQS